MKESPFNLKVEVKLTIQVPPSEVNIVTEKLLDLVKELNVFDGGKLEHSNLKI